MFLVKTILLALLMILVGFIALRLAGRKSLSQMTIAQVVIMIAVGSILVEPIKDEDVFITIISIFVFIGTLIILELLAMKTKFLEWLIIGKKLEVVNNGVINHKNLKKMRMSEEQLLMNLRQKGIFDVKNLQYATMESNGEFGFRLYQIDKPMEVKDYETYHKQYMSILDSKMDRLENRLKSIESKLSNEEKMAKGDSNG